MKCQVVLEYAGRQVCEKEVIDYVKSIWLEAGNKVKDIKTMDVYLKPEENMIYYVINETETGSFPM